MHYAENNIDFDRYCPFKFNRFGPEKQSRHHPYPFRLEQLSAVYPPTTSMTTTRQRTLSHWELFT